MRDDHSSILNEATFLAITVLYVQSNIAYTVDTEHTTLHRCLTEFIAECGGWFVHFRDFDGIERYF